MKKLLVGIALLPLATLVGAQANLDFYTIDAQGVEVRPYAEWFKSRQLVQGHFRIRKADPTREYAIKSEGKGGACIIARDPSAIKTCKTSADCNEDYVPFKLPDGRIITRPPGAHGYCVSDTSAARFSPSTCWWKPSNSSCKKDAKGEGDYSFRVISDQHEVLLKTSEWGKLSWRVGACLNGVDNEGLDSVVDKNFFPCGESEPRPGELIERFGKPGR